MNWWSKIVTVGFGSSLGDPLGALLRNAIDSYSGGSLGTIEGSTTLNPGDTERIQSVFFTCTFALIGFTAKADGRVSPDELKLAEQVMERMNLNVKQRKVAIELFSLGKAGDFPVHDVLAQFRQECSQSRNLVQMFIEIVAATAVADGNLDRRERELLGTIANELGFSTIEFQIILRRLSGEAKFATSSPLDNKVQAAYRLLCADDKISDMELKNTYKRLINQHHPDKLVAKGLPEEMIEIATDKFREIKSAYEMIRISRNHH